MTELNVMLAVLSAVVLLSVAMLRFVKERLFLTEAVIALGVGLLLGPALGWIQPRAWGQDWERLFEEVLRVALAIQIVGISMRLPKLYALNRLRPLLIVLLLVMPMMWMTTTLLTWLFLPLSFWGAAIVAGALAPTDPLLANTITSGAIAERNLPSRLRHLLSAESAANDGLAYLFVFLGIHLVTRPAGGGFVQWIAETLLWHVLVAGIFGWLIGSALAGLRIWCERHHFTFKDQHSLLAYHLGLALFVLGALRLLDVDALFASFTAGTAFSVGVKDEEREHYEATQSTLDRVMIVILFAWFGAILPWGDWVELGWRAPVLVVAILVLKRIPAVLAVHRFVDEIKPAREALLLGWFGPIGAASLFYGLLVTREIGSSTAWAIGSLAVASSVVVHGVTATPLAKVHGTWVRNSNNGDEDHLASRPEDERETGEWLGVGLAGLLIAAGIAVYVIVTLAGA